MSEIETNAILTCPECNTKHKVVMPLEGKQHFFKCPNQKCEAEISIEKDECCVFCSHSNMSCPAKQLNPDGKSKLQSLI